MCCVKVQGTDVGDMAAGTELPTYQRYINGVPVLQSRKTLRLREKYIVLLVFVTFGTVCFGAFFFLPDLRDRVSVTGLRRDFANDVFLPKPGDVAPGRVIRHDPHNTVDRHKVADETELKVKIIEAQKEQQIEADNKIRDKLNITKDEHDKVKQEIKDDKQKVVEAKKKEEKEKEEEVKKKNLQEVKDHAGVPGGQGGVPSDEETKKRQTTVRNVRLPQLF